MPATLTQTFSSIASAIRNRGVSGTMTPAQMSTNISQVQNGNKYGIHMDGILGNIDENGVVHQAADDTMIDIYAPTIRQIPQGVMENEKGFPENPNIRSVSMPNLTTVGVQALQRSFRNCSNLVSVDFSGLTSIPDGTNSNTGAFQYAFSGCTSLQTVDFSSLQSIGNYGLYYAFAEDTNTTNIAANGATAPACSSLKNVDLSSLQSVGNNGMRFAFDGCTSLESIDLSNLTTIGAAALQYAFYNCTSLVEVDLSGLSTISSDTALQRAFEGCSSLTSVDLSNLTSVTGTSAITFLFQNCTALKRMDLSSLTSISSNLTFSNVFRGCTSLEYVDLSNLETTATGAFGSLMFRDCTSLKVVRLTKLMKTGISLPNSMFQNCTSLEVVDFSQASGVPTLSITSEKHAFSTAGSIYRIVVPDSLYDTWIASGNWTQVSDHIVKSSEFYTSQIEYLEGTGTQYIDTGFQGNPQTTRLVIEVSTTTLPTASTFLCGARSTAGNAGKDVACAVCYAYSSNVGTWRLDTTGSYYSSGGGKPLNVSCQPNAEYVFDMSNNTCSVNGTTYSSTATKENKSVGNIFLLSINNGGAVFSSCMKARIKSAKVYDGNTLVRDMVPVRVGEEGCMYDKVNGVIYHNAGSSSFNVGEDTYVANRDVSDISNGYSLSFAISDSDAVSLTLYYADGTSEILSQWPYGNTYQNVVRIIGTTDMNFSMHSGDYSWIEDFGNNIDHYLTCDSIILVTLPLPT